MNTQKRINLSLRLSTLNSYRTSEEVIWDIGCDHGHLGLSFLNSDAREINLLDPSGPVIDTLQKKLTHIDSYITKPKVFIHHKKGQDLTLQSENNIIFIAGMGGKEIGEIIQKLLPQLDSRSRIVISPHRKILELRKLLHHQNIELLHEESVFEDDQFYQMLVLKKGEGRKVSLYGEEIWSGTTGKRYLKHQIENFERHQDPESRAYLGYLKGLNN